MFVPCDMLQILREGIEVGTDFKGSNIQACKRGFCDLVCKVWQEIPHTYGWCFSPTRYSGLSRWRIFVRKHQPRPKSIRVRKRFMLALWPCLKNYERYRVSGLISPSVVFRWCCSRQGNSNVFFSSESCLVCSRFLDSTACGRSSVLSPRRLFRSKTRAWRH